MSLPGFFRFEFDIDMLEVPVDVTGIFVRLNNFEYPLIFSTWGTSRRLLCDHGVATPDPGPTITTYTGADMTIHSAEGIPAVKWANVPIGEFP